MNSIDFATTALAIARVIEDAAQRLAQGLLHESGALMQGYQRMLASPPVPGYESFFLDVGVNSSDAKIYAHIVRHYGKAVHQQFLAERTAVRWLRQLARQSTSLTIGRRATALRACLLDYGGLSALADACARSQVSIDELEDAVLAAERGELLGLELPRLAKLLVPTLGYSNCVARTQKFCTHYMLLTLCNDGLFPCAYTYAPSLEQCTDLPTIATQKAFKQTFDPRPVYRWMVKIGDLPARPRSVGRPKMQLQ